jgi:hypothetical protein
VTEPVASEITPPILAVKVEVALPAGMTMLAGTVIKLDVELNATVVAVAAFRDSVTVHELVAPDIRPIGLQASEVTDTEAGAIREIATDCDEPL